MWGKEESENHSGELQKRKKKLFDNLPPNEQCGEDP
jgi:hypothetical protein